MSEEQLSRIYAYRYSEVDADTRAAVWREITGWFAASGIVRPDDVVADIACGNGEFINSVKNETRYGVDKLAEKKSTIDDGVHFVSKGAETLTASDFTAGNPTLFFVSNFLEHLEDKVDIVNLLECLGGVLDTGGRIVVMGPNISHVKGEYWDFIDHILPLTEKAVEEALASAGLKITRSHDRFLPYSFKSGLPISAALVRAYLRFPPAWKILGKQFLVVGEKQGGEK